MHLAVAATYFILLEILISRWFLFRPHAALPHGPTPSSAAHPCGLERCRPHPPHDPSVLPACEAGGFHILPTARHPLSVPTAPSPSAPSGEGSSLEPLLPCGLVRGAAPKRDLLLVCSSGPPLQPPGRFCRSVPPSRSLSAGVTSYQAERLLGELIWLRARSSFAPLVPVGQTRVLQSHPHAPRAPRDLPDRPRREPPAQGLGASWCL